MGRFDIFDTVHDLRKSGRPFCIATVVRTADVTSAKAGAKAAVTEAGEIIGHLGGACVKRAVRAAGLAAITSGETQVIRVKPSDKVVAMQDTDGVPLYKSGCPSGGSVDVLIEPYELPPMLAIFGTTPISRALAELAFRTGYRVAVSVAMEPSEKNMIAFSDGDLTGLNLTERDFVVVASQGQQDLAALRAAIESPARRVSMVASRRKAEVLCVELAAAGVAADAIARLKSPAGLDLGGIDPHEIAVSVLAELVVWRNLDRKSEKAPEGAVLK